MDNKLSALTAHDFFDEKFNSEEEIPVEDQGQLIGNHTIIKRLTNKRWVIIEMD